MINRFLYLGYYVKQLDRKKFFQFLAFANQESRKSKLVLLLDCLFSVFVYNISILEYFQFGFFRIPEKEKKHWAGTGYMYEYQLKMNPKSARTILDDKRLFYKNYSRFFVHPVASLEELLRDPSIAGSLLENLGGKVVFKVADGKCGAQVEIRSSDDFDGNSLISYMKENAYDLIEAFIIQHPKLNQLSPSAVNTVRVFTQLNRQDEVEILGCRLRISVNSPVDNMAAGNLAAPIDDLTGVVAGPGVYSDITKKDEEFHPITGVKIPGFQIPFWPEILVMVKEAAVLHPQNRSIGWDIVVTEKGPGLIEGNHDWCKLLWQLPVKKGLRPLLEKHLMA